MITVRASVLFLWSTQIYATVYLLVVNVDYTDYETVLAAFGFILWVILNLIWQVFLVPPTIAWYKLAKEAVNFKYYPRRGRMDIVTPDLDDMSYLEKPLRDAWRRE